MRDGLFMRCRLLPLDYTPAGRVLRQGRGCLSVAETVACGRLADLEKIGASPL